MKGWVGLAAVIAALGFASTALGQGSVTATCTSVGQTAPCSPGWYTAPVTVVWLATPAAASASGCSLDITYPYATDHSGPLSCEAFWNDGTSASYTFPLRIEVSAPSITATPARAPDSGGWYNHPVSVSFQGSAFSGIASCTPTQTYAGPDTGGTMVAGSCIDNAGKTATTSVSLRYAATPPAATVSASGADGAVALSWLATPATAPLASVQITRTPGLARAPSSVIATAPSGPYVDGAVKNGVIYTYTITATDQAGNTTTSTTRATPGPHIVAPLGAAKVNKAPLLAWTPVRRATYYNVQLFHNGKVLSTWPRHARLQLHQTWRYKGRRHHLTRGRYRWYVWPGYGRRSAGRYGHLIGTGTFTVS